MFKSLISSDFFKHSEELAIKTIINEDRYKYKKIFDYVREEISRNDDYIDKIVFSEPSKIINSKGSRDIILLENTMTIYTTYSRKIATEIANIIHDKYGKFTQLKCVIPNIEYDIMFNFRTIIKLYQIKRYKTIKLTDLFNTVSIKNTLYFPAHIELTDVYHKLYLPNFYKNRADLEILEPILYNIIINEKMGGAVGTGCSACKIKRKLDIFQIKSLLLKLFNNERFIFIGRWAHKFILGDKYNEDNINDDSVALSIISENDIDIDYANIKQYLREFTPFGIYYKMKKLYIPKDNRICKYTFYIKYPSFGKQVIDKPILDIYNCCSYEVIPIVKIKHDQINLNIGNLYVQLRFLLLDLWLLKLIKFIKGISDEKFNAELEYIFTMLKKLKKNMSIEDKSDNFIGINFDEKIEQKIEISKKNISKTSYYPELSIAETKKYKSIATT